MGLFGWKKKEVDVNIPVTNPGLKNAIAVFNANKTEASLKSVIAYLKRANFLVLILNDEMVTRPVDDGKVVIEKGSRMKFLLLFDKNNNQYLPVLTDWNEVDIWRKTRENISGMIMPAKQAFDFVMGQPVFKGLVINPGSDVWTMNREQIAAFVKENY